MKKTINNQGCNKNLGKVLSCTCMVALITILSTIPAYASNTYAEAGAKWILDGIFWVVLVAGIFGAGMAAIKRNTTGAISIIIATALICVVCQNPEIISSIGNVLKGILGL